MGNIERIDVNQWNRFKGDLESLNYSIARLKLKFELLDSTTEFTHSHGLPFLTTAMQNIFSAIEALDLQARALNAAYAYTQSLTAGAQPSRKYPNDFDIVVQEGVLTSDQIKDATVDLDALNKPPFNLGIAPFVIYAGVSVVALVVGAIATVSIMGAKEKEIEAEVDKLQIELEKKIAENPETLPAWTEFKQSQQKDTRGLIDKLLGPGSGKAIIGGAGGIVVLLVVGYLVMEMFKKKGGSK